MHLLLWEMQGKQLSSIIHHATPLKFLILLLLWPSAWVRPGFWYIFHLCRVPSSCGARHRGMHTSSKRGTWAGNCLSTQWRKRIDLSLISAENVFLCNPWCHCVSDSRQMGPQLPSGNSPDKTVLLNKGIRSHFSLFPGLSCQWSIYAADQPDQPSPLQVPVALS